jgi:hypothetical protein
MDILDMISNICLIDGLVLSNYVINDQTDKYRYVDDKHIYRLLFKFSTGYWTRAIKRFALFDLLKSLYPDIKILSKYIPSLQIR